MADVTYTTERAEDADTTNASSYAVGGSFTPNANSLLILIIGASDSAVTYDVSSVTDSGMGLTWVPISSVEHDNATTWARHAAYYALVGGSPVATTVTVAFTESITGLNGWIGEFAGHDTTTPINDSNTVNSAMASGVETLSLVGAPAADSMVVFTNSVFRSPAAWDASGDGWTEVCDTGHSSPNHGLYVAYKVGDQTISFTGTNGSTNGIIFEILAAAAGGGGVTVKQLAALGAG